MEITSLLFLTFVGVTFLIYYIIPKKYQWVVLLASSVLFFVASSALLTFYMLFTTVVIYLGARWIQKYKDLFSKKKKELPKPERKVLKEQLKKKQKKILIICVVVVIAVLVLTKYCNFIGDIVNGIASIFTLKDLLPEFNILLPLGISYYTLMSVSYITDVYRGTIKAEVNPLRVLLFVCYFPHIVEGPFDRYGDLDKQFRTPHKFDYDKIRRGAILVMYGCFKKLVIADRIGFFLPKTFAKIDNYSGTAVFIGMVLYTFQLYADFSGCIDIISGVSEMFGIKVAENFKQPFFSKSIDEFWRRWHISLGAWLKEYVFYPVSLSGHFKKVNTFTKKHIKSQHIVGFITIAYTLFFVWFCNGLWHGASWLYITYGLYYYVLMMLSKFTQPYTDKLCKKLHINKESKCYSVFQVARTIVIVNFGMLLFRSSTLSEFGSLIVKIFSSINLGEVMSIWTTRSNLMMVALGFIIVLLVGIIKEKGIDIRMWLVNHFFLFRWVVYLFLIVVTVVTGIYGVEYGEAAAIYAQF